MNSENQKKRILIFSLAYFPMVGGAEIAIKEITDRIGDIHFDLITLRFNPSHPKNEKIGNVNVYRIGGGFGYLSKICFIPRATFLALKLSKQKKYSLSWAMMTYMGFSSLFLKIFRKIPYLLTIQEGDSISHITKRKRIILVYFLYKKIFKECLCIQVISNYLADFAKSMGATSPIEVVPNGVDVIKFTSKNESKVQEFKEKIGKQSGDIFLVTTSRLEKKNAIDDVIKALPMLPENIKFAIAGKGNLKEYLEQLTKDLNFEDRVKFLGFVSHEDLPSFLKVGDVFIRPSLSEGFGISFVEAMASGLPVIATRAGGIADFLRHKETGFVCEPKNPQSIADQVNLIISDKDLVEKVKENAFKMVEEKYTWDVVAEKMKKIFNTLS